jgi:hypothetical protein
MVVEVVRKGEERMVEEEPLCGRQELGWWRLGREYVSARAQPGLSVSRRARAVPVPLVMVSKNA